MTYSSANSRERVSQVAVQQPLSTVVITVITRTDTHGTETRRSSAAAQRTGTLPTWPLTDRGGECTCTFTDFLKSCVMAIFTCPLGWPWDAQSRPYFGAFPDKTGVRGLSGVACPHPCGWASPSPLGARKEQRAEEAESCPFASACLLELGCVLPSRPLDGIRTTSSAPLFSASVLRPNDTAPGPLGLGLHAGGQRPMAGSSAPTTTRPAPHPAGCVSLETPIPRAALDELTWVGGQWVGAKQ